MSTAPSETLPNQPILRLVPAVPRSNTALPRCAGCTTPMRPAGTTESQYPGSVTEWGDLQCQSCDYLSAGKDPADRFINVDRVAYLSDLRSHFEQSRKDRGVPEGGLRKTNTRHLQAIP